MTPIMITVLLIYYSGLDNAVVFTESDTWFEDASDALVDAGMLDLGNKEPIVTDKGAAFVQMLRNTPLPIQAWTDPRTLAGNSNE